MTKVLRMLLGVPLLAAALHAGSAHAGEFRKLSLSDGRVLIGEVLSTKTSGIEVRTPQGLQVVPFELLADMMPVEESGYRGQPAWPVYLVGEESQVAALAPAFSAMTNVRVVREGDGFLTDDQMMAVMGCERDFDCMSKLSADLGAPWVWVVYVDAAEDGTTLLRGGLNTGSQTSTKAQLAGDSPLALYEAVSTVFGLIPEKKAPKGFSNLGSGEPTEPPPTRRKPPADTDFSREKVLAMSFVPVPGLPSMMQGDGANFGIAMGVAVPATALWVGVVGKNAQSAGEFVGVGLGGFYAITVATNQILGLNSFNKASPMVLVEPPQHGEGAVVGLTVPLK